YSYNDDFTWIHAKHTFKFGGQLQVNHYNGFGRQCVSGCVNFSYTETGSPGVANSQLGGNGFASALLGLADSGSIDTVRFIGQQFPYYAGYFQDDWKVTSKLVLNLGVRWDATLPPTGLEDRWSDFGPTTPNPAAGNIPGAVLFAGSGAGRVGTRSLADFYSKAFGPHVAFAYSKDAKTVIRGSYARSFGSIVSVSGSTHNMGFTLTQGFNNSSTGINPTFTMEQGMPAWTAPPFINPSVSNGASVSWYQGVEGTKPPASDNINFSIQRQVGNSMTAEIAYNGVMGSHLQSQLLNYNQVNPKYLTAFGTVAQSTTVLNSLVGSPAANAAGITAPFPSFNSLWGSRATVAQALRPYPQYSGIDTYAGGGDHSGHSTYHAAMLKLQKRYSNGLSFLTSYVFSKLLTDSDSYWGNGTGAADFFNRGLEKSIGAYDVTHDFKVSGSYELPFGKGQHYITSGPAAWIIGNWRVAAIGIYDSGQPQGVSTNLSLPLSAGRLPAYVNSYDGWQPTSWKNGKFDPSVDLFFAPYGSGAFPLQGSGTTLNSIGNETRLNPKVRSFHNLNENISIARVFPIWEKTKIEFRAESFNTFNRTRFGIGSTQLTQLTQLQSSNFGRLNGAASQINSPRQIQMSLKLTF
ncbi:MAG TPA: hypothetical protein VNH18_11940, partial [Bryobacteraceae bacterium]|nr:hypothetical protein [Bryobacteraceae bacterium]